MVHLAITFSKIRQDRGDTKQRPKDRFIEQRRPVDTLRAVVSRGRTLRERNHCEQRFDSLIEPPSSAVDE